MRDYGTWQRSDKRDVTDPDNAGSKEMMLTREEYVSLRDYIYEKSGIYFSEGKKYLLEMKLSSRLKALGMNTFESYHQFLRFGGDKARIEIPNLFDVITTNETSFFRNPQQLEAFKVIVRQTIQRGRTTRANHAPIKIWSAACSTGEEPYSLSIVMYELLEHLKVDMPFTIYATDISVKTLELAEKAVYTRYSLRNTDEKTKQKYFVEKDDNFILKDKLKENVRFEFMNLVDAGSYRKYHNIDMIFCRNVLIYFDEKKKRMVVDLLHDSLKSKGYLTIGHAESLHHISQRFTPVIFPGSCVYQRN